MDCEMNSLTLPDIYKLLDPVACVRYSAMRINDLHKLGLKVETPTFDFIEYVANCFHDLEKDFSSFRKKNPKHFFKKIWLYCYYSRVLPYTSLRYQNLLKFHDLKDTLLTRVTFDLMWEKLSKEQMPLETVTFTAYKEIEKKEGSLFAMESFYQETGINQDFSPLIEHINVRVKKEVNCKTA